MKQLTIAVGTTSMQKISYLKEVLKELKIKAVIKPIEVKSEISNQPITSKETKTGSIRRAKNALKEIHNADFSLGIEVGYHKYLKDKYEMFCWATIVDKQGHKISHQSHRFLLPEYHQKILSSGKYLGDNLDSYFKRRKDAIVAHIDNTIRYRKPFIISALKNVIIHYLRKEEF
jgi:non-canonical (house-cleaning) NTP pyrophosphatase